MKKIIYFFLMIMIVSCASHRKTSETSSIKTADNKSLVSQFLEKNYAEDIDIAWTLDDDSVSFQNAYTTSYEDGIKPAKRKPPKKGRIHIKMARQENVSNQHITEVTKIKKTEKQKNKDKQYTKPNVKKKSSNILVNSIIIIIFGIIVKFLFSHKNNLKKVWKKIKNSLTLRHP